MCSPFLSKEQAQEIATANSQFPVVSSRGFCMSLAGRRSTKEAVLKELDTLMVGRFKS